MLVEDTGGGGVVDPNSTTTPPALLAVKQPNSFLFRFKPDSPGDLSKGKLQALQVLVDGAPIVGNWRTSAEIPAETAESKALSKDLKRRGFRFVGPTVCYAFMQAVGLVDDHVAGCFRRDASAR